MPPSFVLALVASLSTITPPDMSLATIPVAYYGANWARTQANIDALAKFDMVTLMQEDGHCWATCCPDAMTPKTGQCGPLHNASAIPGCDASCAQHGAQNAVFKAVKASAAQQGRARPPHCVLYMNSVYLWPFDAAAALGNAVQLLDVHGAPHMESCDPGIFPSFFWDFGRSAAQEAWLRIIRDHILGGAESYADGLYNDCDSQNPIRCPSDLSNNTCVAKRNGKMESVNEVVTRAQHDAYQKGKNATMARAATMVDDAGGSFYNKNAAKNGEKPPIFGGGNTQYHMMNRGGGAWDPAAWMSDVSKVLENYKYVVVGGANDFSSPEAETLPENQDLADGRSLKRCATNTTLAQFLIVIEPGMFLLCNGWDDRFSRPLGRPTGKAKLDNTTQTWTRSFMSGVTATWNVAQQQGTVAWPVLKNEGGQEEGAGRVYKSAT